MSAYMKDNKFVSYLVILISLFILAIFTKDQFSIMQENFDSKFNYEKEKELKRDKLNSLNKIKTELTLKQGEEKSETFKEVEKYGISFSENELIDYFYGYVESLDPKVQELKIRDISFSEGIKNELGFKESNINLNIAVVDENAMIRFLDFLTNNESKYRFFIDNFSYPSNQEQLDFNVIVPLKLFYR